MTAENIIRVIAGCLVLISTGLGWFVSPWFFIFTAFVGFNLAQSGFTKWCPAEKILLRLGLGKNP